jgi:transposase
VSAARTINPRTESNIERLRILALVQAAEVDALRRQVAALGRAIDHQHGTSGTTQSTLDLVAAEIAKVEQSVVPPDAPLAAPLSLDAPSETTAPEGDTAPNDASKPKRGHGPRPQPRLERVPRRFTLDEADCICKSCRGRLESWTGQTEDSEMVDVIEVSYRVVTVERQKYRCRCGGDVVTAEGPERVMPGSRFSLEFALHVAEAKYTDHLPLARQVRAMDRYGLDIDTQTLWDIILALSRRLRPTWEAIHRAILRQSVMGIDQTGWKNLEDKKQKPWQMWCLTAEGLVYHRICDDKSAETFGRLVDGFKGRAVCDAAAQHFAGLHALVAGRPVDIDSTARPLIELIGCWAHIYRKFEEAAVTHPAAQHAVDVISRMYQLDQAATSVEARAAVRRDEIVPLLREFHAWMGTQRPLPSSTFGNALQHTANQWTRLKRFTEDGTTWIDNNPTERGIRGPVVGRRNHFGSKSRRGTEVASIFYTLVETAKLRGVNPRAFLRDAAMGVDVLADDYLPNKPPTEPD